MAELFTIGELAAAFALSPRAIRFYEDQGLLAPERAGTQRIYTKRDRARLQLILRGKRLGFSLAAIREFLDLYDADRTKHRQMAALLDRTRARISELEQQLEEANCQLRVLVRQDGLTGLGSRRHFDDVLGTEYRRAMRDGEPLSLIMVDVDRFKAFNDLYGHPAGDACLRGVGAALAGSLRRPADLAARYGGEEFAVLLPCTDESGALATASRIQEAMRAVALQHAGSEFGIVTLSMGITVLAPGGASAGPAALVEAADAALYAAKRSGRNTAQLTVG